ncbi:hypothetical protein DFH09DRAFT_1318558 [Mycena vulgaris]|nr:hypothetical protein DFH09DRAFT_1318558 [Mycena vulgaris]
MGWTGSGLTVQIPGLLPALREYTGPWNTLRLFLPRESLIRLATPYCLPATFMAQLEEIGTPHKIPSLDVAFDKFDRAALDKLFRFFPRLTDFHIAINYWMEADVTDAFRVRIVNSLTLLSGLTTPCTQVPALFEALAHVPALPPTLKHLAISWKFECDD